MDKLLKMFLTGFFIVATCLFSTAQAHVLDGATKLNGHYYKNFEFKLTWEQAEQFCESVGGHLATVESNSENEIMKKLVKSGGWNYWLGGYKSDDGLWHWVTGGIITDSNWRQGEPSSSEKFNKMLIHSLYGDGKWISHRADEKWSFICEWEKAEDAHDSTL